MQIQAGRKLAPAYLFIGCSHPERDALFADELRQWEQQGIVKLFYAYSKASDLSKGCKYVQDRVWAERDEMTKVFNQGAKLYVCGSAMVGEGISATTKKIFVDNAKKEGKDVSDEEVQSWFDKIKSDRFASDVFA
jgi:cytochrome P450/NADPH-cytochrome P450 reductase